MGMVVVAGWRPDKQQEDRGREMCNALFIYLIILLENIVYYYILYDF